MNFNIALLDTVSHLQDWDIPEDLLPLIICNEAAMRAGFSSDSTEWIDLH